MRLLLEEGQLWAIKLILDNRLIYSFSSFQVLTHPVHTNYRLAVAFSLGLNSLKVLGHDGRKNH